MAEKSKFPPFPADNISQSKKKELDWNKEWIKAAYGVSNKNLVGNINSNRKKFVNLRKYAAGNQDKTKYKNQLASEGNTAQLNLNWDVNTPAPTIIDSLVGKLENQGLKILTKSTSPLAAVEQDKEFKRLKAQAFLARNADELKRAGINVDSRIDKDEAESLQSDKSIKLHLEMNFKDSFSTAMQKAIDFTLESNKFPRLKRKLLRDIVICGRGVLEVCYDSEYNVILKVTDLVEFTHDEVIEDDFSDAKWMGVFEYPSIEEIRRNSDFNEAQLAEIARKAAGKYGNSGWKNDYDLTYYPNTTSTSSPSYSQFKIKVFRAEYKSQDTYEYEVVKKKGGGEFLRRIDIADKNGKMKKVESKDNEVKTLLPINKYKATMVCDTDFVYNYGLCENQLREKMDNGFGHSLDTPFSWCVYAPDIYDMTNKSVMEKLIPNIDLLTLIKLQSQRVIANMTPQGVAVDVAAVAAISNALGEDNITPRKVHNIYKQSGDYYYSSMTEDGDPMMNTQPIRDLPPPDLSALMALERQAAAVINDMSLDTGVPISTVGAPDVKALVGNEKIAAQNRNDATRVIDDTYKDIVSRACNKITLMVQDAIENGGKFDDYEMAIGKSATSTLDFAKDLCAMQFGMFIEVAPDNVEQEFFERSIVAAVTAGSIKQSDVFMVRELAKKDLKQANAYMKVCEEQYEKDKMKQSQAQSQAQAQSAAQAAMQAEQAKQQTLQMEAQLKQQYMMLEYKLKSAQSNQDNMEKLLEIEQEGEAKLNQIRLAMGGQTEEEDSTSQYDKINLPKKSGLKMPAISRGQPTPAKNL